MIEYIRIAISSARFLHIIIINAVLPYIFLTAFCSIYYGEVHIVSPQSMKEMLLERTISVIADEGLDKTTTKAITAGTGINEAYIYRHFADKNSLLACTFDKLDYELVAQVTQNLPIMYMKEIEYEHRCRIFFDAIWRFMLGNRNHCLAFVRYYYSPYFVKYSLEAHKQRYLPLVDAFGKAFKKDADVWMILNHILNVMLDFAVKVHNGQMSKDDNYSEHVFRVIYRSIDQYFE